MKKKIIAISIVLISVIVASFFMCHTWCQLNNLGLFFDKEYLDPLISQIDSAQTSIVVEMYSFTNYRPIIQALIRAGKRNIDVKLYVDNQDPNNPNKKNEKGELVGLPEKELQSAGCKVKWQKSRKVMHRKICVIDCQIIAAGSHNWTKNAFESNEEVSRIYQDENQACQIIQEFDKDWSQAVEDYP